MLRHEPDDGRGCEATVILTVTIGATEGRHWAAVDLPDGRLEVFGRGLGSPIPALAREMTQKGVSPSQRMRVVRETGIQSFAPAEVGWWADRTVTESEKVGVRFAKYTPFDRTYIEAESER